MTTSTNTADFRARVTEALATGVIIGDGHSLYSPDYYAPHFTADELRKARLVRKHESDGSPKGSIFGEDGSVIAEIEAVYNLDFLAWVASMLGVTKYARCEGRGSRAQEYVGFIREALAE